MGMEGSAKGCGGGDVGTIGKLETWGATGYEEFGKGGGMGSIIETGSSGVDEIIDGLSEEDSSIGVVVLCIVVGCGPKIESK